LDSAAVADIAVDDQSPPDAPEDSELHAQRASRSLRHGLISLALLIALVAGLLLAVPGLHGVARTVTHMQAGWIGVAVALEILSCVGYVLAFLQVFDRAPVRFGARVALTELAFGAAVSLGGAGSVAVGAWLLVDRGGPPARVAERSAVLFLLTSAVNVVTLAICGLALSVGLLPGSSNPLLTIVPGAVGALALVFFLLLPRYADRLAGRTSGRVHTLLTETAVSIRATIALLRSPDWRILGAIGYLWFDLGALAACFAAIGHVPPLSTIVLAYQIAYLSNLIPVPGGIGVLDGSFIGMFVLYGVSATTATAATIAYHAIALWIPAIWGTLAFLLLQRTRGRPITLRPPRDERQRLRRERRAGPGGGSGS
jgi:uncharacterized membrane protein YbhN (UPF0104 family)